MTRRSPGYEFLIELYLRYRTTVDRLASQPERLAALTAELNARGFNYTSGEIMPCAPSRLQSEDRTSR